MEQAITHDQESADCIITRDSRILGGKPIVAGQRIPLRFVISFGDTPEGHRRAQENYPTLTIAQVEAAFAYWRAHPEIAVW
ncbi:MAG TPA: DUF433 domain-containing protein [Thermomicrobiales bacterium]|jgi:uncharacterized protein (DUF433 family)